MTRHARATSCLTIALTAAAVGLSAQSAVASDLPGFAGFARLAMPALAYRATISVPDTLPAGSVAQYAWVMAEGTDTFTQVGWAWWPGRLPQVFAYTAPMTDPAHGTWAMGPNLDIGSVLTVQLSRAGGFLSDQYQLHGAWTTIQSALVPALGEQFITDMEDYGPPMPTCFTSRGWESAPQIWHSLVGGCF